MMATSKWLCLRIMIFPVENPAVTGESTGNILLDCFGTSRTNPRVRANWGEGAANTGIMGKL